MRKSLASLVGTILIIVVGILLYTRNADARDWAGADGGWAYSQGQVCRNGVTFGLGFFQSVPITIERTLAAPVTTQVLTLSKQRLNPDPNPGDPSFGAVDYSGFFAIPWTQALAPSTVVTLTFVTTQGDAPLTWTTENASVVNVVEDCYLPDLALTMTDSPDPVTIGGTFKYTVNVTNPTPKALVTETARDAFPTNFASITIPASGSGPGSAAPYPSEIGVAGLTGSVTGITVTLTSLRHINPDDLDILLVGPRGQKVLLMSDAGGGFGFSDVDLVFDDAARAALPDNNQISAGSYKPSDYADGTDTFPAPAPAGPYGSTLAAFNRTDPNGVWRLFIYDDHQDNDGSLLDWKLTISTTTPAATVVDTLPAGTTFISAAGTGWNCSRVSRTVTCIRNSLPRGVAPSITITARAPWAVGDITNRATVTGSHPDLKSANNTATVTTFVSRGVFLPFVIR